MGTVPRPLPGEAATSTPVQGRAPSAQAPAIVIDNVTLAYDGHIAARDISLTLHRGTFTTLIGPNGSGKSSLLGSISGLLRPVRGSIRIFGEPATAARRRVAHMLQTTVANEAVPITVRETVRMGCYGLRGAFRRLTAQDRAAIEEAIDRMRIGDIAHRQLRELSGGQRQRVYVAQGLAQRADILLLDEPITGLDLVTQETITEVIREERDAGRCVVVTTHDVGTASLADQAVLLATHVVAAGAPTEALSPEHLATAYGGHVHVLEDGTVILDEPHHHDHRHHDQL